MLVFRLIQMHALYSLTEPFVVSILVCLTSALQSGRIDKLESRGCDAFWGLGVFFGLLLSAAFLFPCAPMRFDW